MHTYTHACVQDYDYDSTNYTLMYYKNDQSIGIRTRTVPEGKTIGPQIFSFGRKTGLGEKVLRAWGAKVMRKMDGSELSEPEAKVWINAIMTRYRF